MRKKIEILKVEDVTLDMVKSSAYGCRNCLWASIECQKANKFQAAITRDCTPTCKAYSYFD